MTQPKIAVISHQKLFRTALAYLLANKTKFAVQGEYGSFSELKTLICSVCPLIYIIDSDLPESEIKDIIKMGHHLMNKSVVLGNANYNKRLVELIPLKADGYFTTDLSETAFVELLGKVATGGPVIADSLLPDLCDKVSQQAEDLAQNRIHFILTPREKEILELLTSGCTNTQIAKKLVISSYTVKNHVHHILEKLGIKNRSELISFAFTRGLLSNSPKELPKWSLSGS